MKTFKYQKRFYRDWIYSGNLYRKKIIVCQTDLEILTTKPIDEKFVISRIQKYRRQIELYISKDERFLTALKPLVVELNAPRIVQEMAVQSRKANVGPMASVAGAIAQFIGKDLLGKGNKTVIIENGGDIFLKTAQEVKVGLYAGKMKVLSKLNLKIKSSETPLGICASSGVIGHSLSFGNADCVVIIAKNAILSDAVATATANRVQVKEDLTSAINFARSIGGVRGVVIIYKNSLASWGKIEFG